MVWCGRPARDTGSRWGPWRCACWTTAPGAGGAVAIAEFYVPPRVYTTPTHVHRAHDEGFYVLEGLLEFLVGAATVPAGPGTFVQVPRGVLHTFRNPGPGPARFLNTFAPPRYLDYFAELSALLSAPGEPSHEQRRALMARYATDVVTP